VRSPLHDTPRHPAATTVPTHTTLEVELHATPHRNTVTLGASHSHSITFGIRTSRIAMKAARRRDSAQPLCADRNRTRIDDTHDDTTAACCGSRSVAQRCAWHSRATRQARFAHDITSTTTGASSLTDGVFSTSLHDQKHSCARVAPVHVGHGCNAFTAAGTAPTHSQLLETAPTRPPPCVVTRDTC